MKGICLKFYVHQFQKHQEILLYEWLLEKAKKLNYPGGSAFLSLASFGSHKKLHESHFYELGGGNLIVQVSFTLNEEQVDEYLALLKRENLHLFYEKFPVEFGYI